ncbi:MAG: hypothetical protein ABI882_19220, partial [Acidobacteriota bacterium]
MFKPKLLVLIRPRPALAIMLALMSAATGVVLYRSYRARQEGAARAASESRDAQVAKTLKENRENLKFIENKGQWPAEVRYALETATGAVWIRKDDVLFRAFREVEGEGEEKHDHENGENASREQVKQHTADKEGAGKGSGQTAAGESSEEHEEEEFESHAWKMKLVEMNPNYRIRTGDLQPTIYNYFQGGINVSGARSFKEVTLEGVYPGVDLRFYSGDNRQIEYDFIVAPGADFRRIRIDYEGQDSLKLGGDGSLELGLRFGTIKTHLPEAYQIRDGRKLPVDMGFQVEGSRARFEPKGVIDQSLPLVIDPTLLWGTYFDNNTTTFDAYCYASKADACGNVYVGGYVNEAITPGYRSNATGFNTTFGVTSNAVLYRLNAAGTTVLNFTYFGGVGEGQASTFVDLDIFPNGNVIAVGRSEGSFTTVNAYQSNKGNPDGTVGTGMVVVFNPALASVLYASYLGGDNLSNGN